MKTQRIVGLIAAHLAGLASVLAVGTAQARIDLIEFFDPAHAGRVCNEFSLRAEYDRFLSSSRVQIERGGVARVRLIGDGADFATGVTDNAGSGVSAAIYRRGTMNRPGAGPMFGGYPQVGYVDVDITVRADATLGRNTVFVQWLSGTEQIPMIRVAECPNRPPIGSGGTGLSPRVRYTGHQNLTPPPPPSNGPSVTIPPVR